MSLECDAAAGAGVSAIRSIMAPMVQRTARIGWHRPMILPELSRLSCVINHRQDD